MPKLVRTVKVMRIKNWKKTDNVKLYTEWSNQKVSDSIYVRQNLDTNLWWVHVLNKEETTTLVSDIEDKQAAVGIASAWMRTHPFGLTGNKLSGSDIGKTCSELYPNDCKQFMLPGAHACKLCPHCECSICQGMGFVMLWTGKDMLPRPALCGDPRHKNIPTFT